MFTSIALYFIDLLAASTLLLLGVFLLWHLLWQPVARLMLARWTLYGLSLLVFLCAMPGRIPLGFSLVEPTASSEAKSLSDSGSIEIAPIVFEPIRDDALRLPEFRPDVRAAFDSYEPTLPLSPSNRTTVVHERSITPTTALALLQITGMVLILGRLLLGTLCASRICRNAKPFGTFEGIVVLESDEMTVPVVLGFYRPKILLPGLLCRTRNEESLRLSLEHELAHVRHGDLGLLALYQLLLPLLFLQPLFWFFKNRLRREQEFLVDAAVAESTRQRNRYVEELLQWAKLNREKPRPSVSMLGLASMLGIVE